MRQFEDSVLVAHVHDTTKSAGPSTPGTIIATKRGDWIWWTAAGLLIVGAVYVLYNPHLLRSLFA